MANLVLVFSILMILSATQGILAVDYTVNNTTPNTAGGARFDRDIGAPYTLQTMNASTCFTWGIFEQTSPADRKAIQTVSLFVDDMDGVAYASGDQIHVSARYIIQPGDVKLGFTGVLYHEMAHVWQWFGNGQQVPGGLIEGIADYVRLKADYAASHWVSPGQGDRWDQGYDVTARFLDYCNSLRGGFVAELNKKMRSGYSNSYFVDLLGKTVDQLWMDYKAKYANT
ncbi:hypothetical protein CASFOL_004712 [Castilleja foliolosa]|uniref:Plant basic secretory protein (BSP) family protein n=1 Tax=Castilleja foliolosa TaxID=1961234 RepID=A0ABD3EBA5_9LAMI